MRKPIDSVPRNGEFVILENAERGTIAVARWSAETEQWLDEDGTPSQLNATHWHLPQNVDEGSTPSQLNATYWSSLPPAPGVAETADGPGSLSGPSKLSVQRGASCPETGDKTVQLQRAAQPGSIRARFVDFIGRGCGKALPPFVIAGGWIADRRRSIVTMAACLFVGAAIGGVLGKSLIHWTAPEDDSELKQALAQERERASKLDSEVAAAKSQAALMRQASDASAHEKDTSERTVLELRQALQSELAKTNKLVEQLAEAQRNNEARTELTSEAIAEARRVEAEKERVIGELREALKQQEDKTSRPNVRTAKQLELKQERDTTEKLRAELAAARREGKAQAAMLRSASEEAARLKEASAQATEALRQAQDKTEKLAAELTAGRHEVEDQTAAARAARDETRRLAETSKRSTDEQGQALREAQAKAEKLGTELAAARKIQSQVERSTDEQRRALQQERDTTGKLAAELAEAKASLEAQAKTKAAEEVIRNNQLAAIRGELQKAKAEAEATLAREPLEAERTRTQPATALSVANQPSTEPPSAQAPAKEPTSDARQLANTASQLAAAREQGNPQTVRLIARAKLLLEQGNIGAARNMLDQAAAMGSTEALFWLAETYDPRLLAARQTYGTQSDVAKARELYGKALAGGIGEARARLQALQQ